MASLMYDCANLSHTIDKVAKWMATSDSQVCLFADDTSVSILSSPSTNSVGEQGRQVLIDRLKSDAVSRMKSLLRSTARQENNHNEFKKKSSVNDRRVAVVDTCSSDSSNASPNRNQNNRHGTESEHRRKTGHSESRHRRQSQPSNGHSVSGQRKDSGDGEGFKEDNYLERIVDRATQEIRSAIYKFRAENKLPEKCHLKMKLSIKPQRSVPEATNSPKEQHEQRRHRGGGTGGSRIEDDGRHRASKSGRHRTSERDGGGGGKSDREKRPTSSSNKRDHNEQRKEKRKY